MTGQQLAERKVLEYEFRIGIQDLIFSGVFELPGKEFTFEALVPRSDASWIPEPGIRLKATVDPVNAEGTRLIHFQLKYQGLDYFYAHRIDPQPVNYGGFRWFFRCADCGRRCKHLYLTGTTVSCRKCCALVYQRSKDHNCRLELLKRSGISELKSHRLRSQRHPRLANRLKRKAIWEWAEHFDRNDCCTVCSNSNEKSPE